MRVFAVPPFCFRAPRRVRFPPGSRGTGSPGRCLFYRANHGTLTGHLVLPYQAATAVFSRTHGIGVQAP